MKNEKPAADQLIKEIQAKLDTIETLMAWSVKADRLYSKGQRVRFADKAMRGWQPKTRAKVRGTILKIDGFVVEVRWDDRKHPDKLHHTHIRPLSGRWS